MTRPAAPGSRAHTRALVGLACVVLGSSFGCATVRDAASDAAYVLNPFSGTELGVAAVSAIGPYLLVDVSGRREQLRLMTPISAACTAIAQPEAKVRYQKSGVFGRLERNGERCDAVGVASLEAWRNRQPRRRTGAQVVPRATARFAQIAETDRYLLVRGRFPLASRVKIPAGFDLVALLPANAACRAARDRGQGSLEFRPAGRDPFRLPVGSDTCVIEGFATPID